MLKKNWPALAVLANYKIFMKIYTKTGDQGETSLGKGRRVSKADPVIECLGSLDELNAYLGWLADSKITAARTRELKEIQRRIFVIGSLVADCATKKLKENYNIALADVTNLELMIDQLTAELEPLEHFILPGGHVVVSRCHLARAVCRRAERRLVAVAGEIGLAKVVLEYLNRLSDYLFTLARWLAKQQQIDESEWRVD